MLLQGPEFCITEKICVVVSMDDLRYLCDFCNFEFPGSSVRVNIITAHNILGCMKSLLILSISLRGSQHA